jgi:hypothetical protein
MKRILALAMAPGLAMAQSSAPTPASAFAAVLQDPGHRQDVLQAAEQSPAAAHLACGATTYVASPQIAVYVPVRFNPEGAPIAGEWQEKLTVTGCGQSLTLNVLTKVTAPSTLATGALLPGDTIADPALQNAAQLYVVRAAGGIPAACTDPYISNTAFNGYTGPKNNALPPGTVAAPWTETWSLNICGTTRAVPVHFTPTPQGVEIGAG